MSDDQPSYFAGEQHPCACFAPFLEHSEEGRANIIIAIPLDFCMVIDGHVVGLLCYFEQVALHETVPNQIEMRHLPCPAVQFLRVVVDGPVLQLELGIHYCYHAVLEPVEVRADLMASRTRVGGRKALYLFVVAEDGVHSPIPLSDQLDEVARRPCEFDQLIEWDLDVQL